jgi:hypothetical protein
LRKPKFSIKTKAKGQTSTPTQIETPISELERILIDTLNAGYAKEVWRMIDRVQREYRQVSISERDYAVVYSVIQQVFHVRMGYEEMPSFDELKRNKVLFDLLKAFTKNVNHLIKNEKNLDQEQIKILRHNIIWCVALKVSKFPSDYCITLKTILNQFQNIEAYVDEAFPGYLASGMLGVLLSKNYL